MKKYLKLIKESESYNTWKDSDEAGYPHVAMYEDNHPEVTSGEGIIFEKSTEKPKIVNKLTMKESGTKMVYTFDYPVASDLEIFFKFTTITLKIFKGDTSKSTTISGDLEKIVPQEDDTYIYTW